MSQSVTSMSVVYRYSNFITKLVLLMLMGCIEPFEPKTTNNSKTYLVVDGAINSQGVSNIRLSRTVEISDKQLSPPESKARVFIEQEGGVKYPLIESSPGTYTSSSLILRPDKQVRLLFTLASGKEYASDFTLVNTTPAIDSISWKAGSQGVQLAINAHDKAEQSRYYRWSYAETWEFTSAFVSQVEYKTGKIISRSDDIYHCWGSEASTAIKLGTTEKLVQDVVSEQPLTLLPANSVKLRYKYSVLVKQYALTREEYNYWEALRKNTENIGTLFDPLPTQLTGNIHSLSDAAETVIGFVGAQSVTEKRIFISVGQLPRTWRFATGYETCTTLDTIPSPSADGLGANPLDVFGTGFAIPVSEFQLPGRTQTFYTASTPACVDCRKRGTNVRPSFWQ